MTKPATVHARLENRLAELRCECHRLLARIDNRGCIVLRCPRCKKQAVVSLAGLAAARQIKVEFDSL